MSDLEDLAWVGLRPVVGQGRAVPGIEARGEGGVGEFCGSDVGLGGGGVGFADELSQSLEGEGGGEGDAPEEEPGEEGHGLKLLAILRGLRSWRGSRCTRV